MGMGGEPWWKSSQVLQTFYSCCVWQPTSTAESLPVLVEVDDVSEEPSNFVEPVWIQYSVSVAPSSDVALPVCLTARISTGQRRIQSVIQGA
jgi:hypothetical protein